MEGVLLKVRCQIIADFYGKNVPKWKTFTVCHFKKMECKKKLHLLYNANGGCRRVSHAERKPHKLTTAEELQVKSSINNEKSVSIPNLVTFHLSANLRSLGDSHLSRSSMYAICPTPPPTRSE